MSVPAATKAALAYFLNDAYADAYGANILRRLEVVSQTVNSVTFGLPVGRDLLNPLGGVHGAVYALLGDVCTSFALALVRPEAAISVSVDLSTQYLGKATENEYLIIHCAVARVGRRLAFTTFEVRAQPAVEASRESRLVAMGTHIKSIPDLTSNL